MAYFFFKITFLLKNCLSLQAVFSADISVEPDTEADKQWRNTSQLGS